MYNDAWLWNRRTKEPNNDSASGSIYGVITDFATGNPVSNANVSLRSGGETALTGCDGMYEFLDVTDGDYTIIVTKAEYTDLIDDYIISIKNGRWMRRYVQIKKLPTSLRITDTNGSDITSLDYGSETQEAIKVYDEVISICQRYETNKKMLASALMSKTMLHLSPDSIEVADIAIAEALSIFSNLYEKEPDKILPSLMLAKYIKMLIASHSGNVPNAIETGESVIDSFYNANDTLKSLCVQEVIQTLLYLKELHQALGQDDKEFVIDAKFAEINKGTIQGYH